MTQYSTQTNDFLNTNRNIYEVVYTANGTSGNVVSTVNPLPVSLYTSTGENSVSFSGGSIDAFGRLRTSSAYTLFDSQHRYDENGKWSENTSGSGSSTHNANDSSIEMDVTDASGDEIIRETKRIFSYQPGKSLLIMTTFVMNVGKTNLRQRVGYFGSNDGIYFEQDDNTLYMVLRSSITGSVVNTRVAQTDWNVDKLDGTGNSGITIDPSKAQIFWADIEWLGVGSVRVGFVIDGKFYNCHTFHNANDKVTTYMRTAHLPCRVEITNKGATSSSSQMKQICATVISEEGFEKVARENFIKMPSVKGSIGTTLVPMVSFRLKSTRLDSVIVPSTVSFMGVAATGTSEYEVVLVKNATLSGTPSWVTSDFDNVEYDLSASGVTISNNNVVRQFYATSTNQAATTLTDSGTYNLDLQIGRTLAGVSDVYTLCCRTLSGTNSAIGALGFYDLTN